MAEEKLNPDGTLAKESFADVVNEIAEKERAENVAAQPEPKPEPDETTTPTADAAADQTTTKPDDEDQAEPSSDAAKAEPDETAKSDEDESDDWWKAPDVQEFVSDLGYSPEELADFSGPDELKRHVRLMDRQFARLGKESEAGPEKPKGEAEPEPEVKVKEREQPKAKKAGELDDDLKALLDEDYDEKVVRAMQEQRNLASQVADLQRQLRETLTHVQTQAQRQAAEQQEAFLSDFDEILDGSDFDPFRARLGKGPARAGTKEHTGRSATLAALNTIVAGMRRSGRNPAGSLKSMVKRACEFAFPEDVKKHIEKQVRSKAKEQASRRIGGPASGKVDTVRAPRDPDEMPKELGDLWNEMANERGTA